MKDTYSLTKCEDILHKRYEKETFLPDEDIEEIEPDYEEMAKDEQR